MEIKFTFGTPVKTVGTISMNKMINRLLTSFQPAAVKKNSFFINEIPHDIIVHVNKNMLAAVISELLTSVVHKTKNSCVHISAKRYSNIILFRLKDSHVDGNMFDYNWRTVNPLVERLGGCITINEAEKKSSSLTFSFRCLSNVA